MLDRKHMGFSALGSAGGMDRTHQVKALKWLLARKTWVPNGFSLFGATDLGWLCQNPEVTLPPTIALTLTLTLILTLALTPSPSFLKAQFSLLSPGAHILPHAGPTNERAPPTA